MGSIYDQLSRALGQAARYGQRSILLRGQVIECAVLLGNTETKMVYGGLASEETIHLKIQKELIPGVWPVRTNEPVVYPAQLTDGIQPGDYKISQVIADEFSVSLTLVDAGA